MRTTLDLDDDLLRRARTCAAQTHRTLTAFLEDALREVLSRERRPARRARVRLPVSPQPPGLCPGVDLDSSAGVLDIMEAADGPVGR